MISSSSTTSTLISTRFPLPTHLPGFSSYGVSGSPGE
jgi:hypothetical protein